VTPTGRVQRANLAMMSPFEDSFVRNCQALSPWQQEARSDPTRFHFWGPLKNLIGRWELRDISVLAK
jgi:hypothetical protein